MYVEVSKADALTGHIHNFDRWKKDLTRSLKSFRLWLGRNNLYSENVDQRVSSLLKILKDDYITIAFAGEFSRGKTELINAMFFASYNKRILPSQAGRTTMCPTELFYDQHKNSTYLRLLPIETRSDPRPLNAFRHLHDYWLESPLDTQSAEAMSESLLQVTETQMVEPKIAEELGFNISNLETIPGQELVAIPKWRHALVSFDHPLLKQGLCILDTPGLNALGSEPELTLSLLPRAQAVIFLLAADAGVTASDMTIWNEHISQLKNRPNLGLYAVLNKVDVLWDELSSRNEIKKNVDKVISTTAELLGIPRRDVIPVSAQKGLLARVKNDPVLLARSHLNLLEDMLSNSVMVSKEKNLWETVISDARVVVQDSLKTLENRRIQLSQQQSEMEKVKGSSIDNISKLLEDCQSENQFYQQKMLTIKPSIRLMERQTKLLQETLSSEKIQQSIDQAAHKITQAKSTITMLNSMREFYFSIEAIMIEFCHEAELTNKMAESIYKKFQEEYELEPFTPRILTAKYFHRQLKDIIRDSDQFNRHVKLVLSSQPQVVNRFFNTTVYNITTYFEDTNVKLENWTKNIMHPLIHQVEDHRLVLDTHMKELELIHNNEANATDRINTLNTEIEDLDYEHKQCSNTLHLLDNYRPDEKSSNILQFNQNKL